MFPATTNYYELLQIRVCTLVLMWVQNSRTATGLNSVLIIYFVSLISLSNRMRTTMLIFNVTPKGNSKKIQENKVLMQLYKINKKKKIVIFKFSLNAFRIAFFFCKKI